MAVVIAQAGEVLGGVVVLTHLEEVLAAVMPTTITRAPAPTAAEAGYGGHRRRLPKTTKKVQVHRLHPRRMTGRHRRGDAIKVVPCHRPSEGQIS